MKENENQSLEELRLEDYLAGRKGPQQQQQQSFGFGQMNQQNKFGMNHPTGGTGLFGAKPPENKLFGNNQNADQSNGTVFKYNPVTGTDTMTVRGSTYNIQTKIEVITAMKEYENRSLEKLRLEDYLAGRKGPQQQQQQSFGFGQMNRQNKFGINYTTPSTNLLSGSTTRGTGLFDAKPPENKSLFSTNQNAGKSYLGQS